MKALALTSVFVLAACGTDYEPDDGDDDPPPPSDPTPVDGAATYRDACAQCHGADGDGNDMGPQILSPVVPYATYVIHTGRDEMGYADPMPSFTGELTDAEITAVLAWLALPPKPTDGAGLYRRFCGNCHGDDAWGGRVDEDLTGKADEPDEVLEEVREGHHDMRYGEREKYMPAWSASELTNAEVALITGYIASLPPAPDDDDDDD